MKIKNNIKPSVLAPEGIHGALVQAVTPKGDSKCAVEFKLEIAERTYTASKVYPAKIECGSPLVDDAQVILGHRIECDENGADFDTDALVGRAAQVVVEHKKTSGGRIIAVVTTVFEPIKAEAAAK